MGTRPLECDICYPFCLLRRRRAVTLSTPLRTGYRSVRDHALDLDALEAVLQLRAVPYRRSGLAGRRLCVTAAQSHTRARADWLPKIDVDTLTIAKDNDAHNVKSCVRVYGGVVLGRRWLMHTHSTRQAGPRFKLQLRRSLALPLTVSTNKLQSRQSKGAQRERVRVRA